MIHTCIYDNVFNDGGYRIHARSANFPAQFESDILEVSGYFVPGKGNTETTAIRYAPLGNGKYLLSWVLRHPVVYAEEDRAWHTDVHFLMDGKDADALFRHPISVIAKRAEKTAKELLKKGSQILDGEVEFFQEDEPAADIWYAEPTHYDSVLMAGAYYCVGRGGPRQLFLAAEEPFGEMDCIQSWIPYRLRKKLSFCVGLRTQTESKNTIFNFPTEITIRQLQDAPGESPPMSDKFWQGNSFGEKKLRDECKQILDRLNECSSCLRGMIFEVITEWDQLKLLATKDLRDGMRELIRYTEQETWCNLVRSAKLNNGELQELLALIPRKQYAKELRNEIKKRLNKPLKGKQKSGNAEKGTAKETNTDSEDAALKKHLWNNARRGAAVVVIVVAAIALITFFRQVLSQSAVEVGKAVYYVVSREAAADALKLCGAYLCGVLSACAGIGLIGSFMRKE